MMQKYALGLAIVVAICLTVLLYRNVLAAPGVDQMANQLWWQTKIQQQVAETADRQYTTCLFGDSISSPLGQSLGEATYNFAIGGMSSVSLVQQLTELNQSTVSCQSAIVAIGTNDAMYVISNEDFVDNMKRVIGQLRALGSQQITLIPAFYSTVRASQNPGQAGTLDRVDEITTMLQQVAVTEQVAIANDLPQALYADRSLRQDLTLDGVHLNQQGKQIYQQLLLDLIQSQANQPPNFK